MYRWHFQFKKRIRIFLIRNATFKYLTFLKSQWLYVNNILMSQSCIDDNFPICKNIEMVLISFWNTPLKHWKQFLSLGKLQNRFGNFLHEVLIREFLQQYVGNFCKFEHLWNSYLDKLSVKLRWKTFLEICFSRNSEEFYAIESCKSFFKCCYGDPKIRYKPRQKYSRNGAFSVPQGALWG